MPKAEKGTPKAIANAMKSKGLQRLRWYCQVCEKQCRDENGFKCHTMSEGHLRQMLVVGENAGKHINQYSEDFKRDFLALISRRWGTKRVLANMVYQEYIADKHHLHMNATQWVTLTDFCKQMGREGVMHVEETEKGWYIAWIDNSPQALARQAANQAKERSEMDDEQRMRKLIAEQIDKANREQAERHSGPTPTESTTTSQISTPQQILQRDPASEPIQLSFGIKASSISSSSPAPQIEVASHSTPTTSAPISLTRPKSNAGLSTNPKPNPFKKVNNPLKGSGASSSKKTESSTTRSLTAPKSALESIIAEEEARKRKISQATWSGPAGHGAQGLQVRGPRR
ncbi:hypothetical protein CROQUDRAFT_665117 [Cronartium quercuum f. sp. fusiforme G11]|uniref:DNA/RNA-binding protein Kin17 WH-like domain-containing protein n=1 Tax=Cronartium quercuum f. sp. fusiforme G11 TaxID=708437 RepID=A0A9P6T664_9BASI|nr:hypothetical protein CROQUDRAFT_665117 [Cronartium quercuum f. sp. fusiforme G11]